MRYFSFLMICLLGASRLASADALPADVRPNHWAAQAVPQALQNGLLVLQDKKFNGEIKVTHAQAAIAIAKLAHLLEDNTWKKQASVVVPNKVIGTLENSDWNKQLVSRYVLAYALSRFGNYVANGLPRPKPGATDLGKSEILETATIKTPRTDPSYESLAYLAKKRMISHDSPLLKPGGTPILGAELSRALAEMTAGVNDVLTGLNHDANGETPDATFHPKPKK